MGRIAALIGLAAAASTALAQPGDKTYIVVKVRPLGSGSSVAFSDHLSVVHPDRSPVDVEVGLFYYRSGGFGIQTVVNNVTGAPFDPVLGDSAAVLDDNPTSTLHPDGRVGTFNFGGQLQVVYQDAGINGVRRFRIAANGNSSDNAAGGISTHQNTPLVLGGDFMPFDGALGYHFKLTMACATDGSPRTMTIDAPRDRISVYRVYTTQSGDSADIFATLQDSIPATITISVPAPASLSLILIGVVVAHLRRR